VYSELDDNKNDQDPPGPEPFFRGKESHDPGFSDHAR
jgi:hypothetical protein